MVILVATPSLITQYVVYSENMNANRIRTRTFRENTWTRTRIFSKVSNTNTFLPWNIEHERTRTRFPSKLLNTAKTNEHEYSCISSLACVIWLVINWYVQIETGVNFKYITSSLLIIACWLVSRIGKIVFMIKGMKGYS